MALPVSVQTKLRRAQEHFDAVLAEVAAFDERDPYRIVSDHNADMTEHYLHLSLTEPFPSARWGAIVGDGIQNLRSALDHLIYAIAIRDSGQDPPPMHRRLMFPILDPPKPLPIGRIGARSAPVRAAVEGEQPDPARLLDSPLWHLDQLNNADKHRVIHVTFTYGDYSGFRIKPSVPCKAIPAWNPRPLDSGAPLLTLKFDRPVPDVKVDSRSTALVGIQGIDAVPDPHSAIFWPIGDLSTFLQAGVEATIRRVAQAAGL